MVPSRPWEDPVVRGVRSSGMSLSDVTAIVDKGTGGGKSKGPSTGGGEGTGE